MIFSPRRRDNTLWLVSPGVLRCTWPARSTKLDRSWAESTCRGFWGPIHPKTVAAEGNEATQTRFCRLRFSSQHKHTRGSGPLSCGANPSSATGAEGAAGVQDGGVDARGEARRGDGVQRRRRRRQLVPGPHGRGLPRHPRPSQARRPRHRGPRRPRESPTSSLLWLAY